MAHRALLALAILAAIYGCSQKDIPIDLTQEALRQVRSGEYDEAIKTASQALAEKPDSAAAYLYRGRAYHYRNAMGDHQRAIADFSESIRLAPKSSDAYYSRALVRRDLGQADLAATDETAARELDEVVQDAYRRLPDQAPPVDVPTAQEVAKKQAGGLPSSEDEQKKIFEKLKGRFEPGFGELRTPTSRPAGGAAAKSGGSVNDRYRDLLEQSNREEARKAAIAEAAQSLTEQSPSDPLPGSTVPGTAGPGTTGPGFGVPGTAGPGTAAIPGSSARPGGAARPGGTWQGPLQPPLLSPFAQRTAVNPSGQMGPTINPNLQSPFQQVTPGATGFSAPQSPFGAQARQPTAPLVRPFGAGTANRFSNPAVRPANPRDYVP